MEQKISEMTDEQAQHALDIFYSNLPDSFLEGGKKPDQADLEYLAFELQEMAPKDIQPYLEIISENGNSIFRAELSRIILHEFYKNNALCSYIDEAIHRAKEPCMAPIPVIFPLIVFLAVVPKKIEWDNNGNLKRVELGQLKEAAELIKPTLDLVNSLPKKLLELLREWK